ncbi:MAG: precorrin-3B C(17)-methyltransferase, partial [Alphaproteobacteria bacterium]
MGTVNPVFLCLTPRGLALGERLAQAVGGECHGRAGRCEAEVQFDDTLAHIRDLFLAGRPIIGLCAAGILIRAVAPLLADKRAEPPVIALAEDGSAVLPLLGGHGGANALAGRIADALGIRAAITTAGDLGLGVALDDPPPGWQLANPQDAPAAMAAAVSGAGIETEGELPWPGLDRPGEGAPVRLIGSEAPLAGDALSLVYHPQRHVLGVGCARNCPPEELRRLAEDVLAEAGIAPGALAALASLDLKSDEPAVLELARALDIPALFFTAAELEAETPRLANPSDTVFAEVGCHGVAEAAALAAAGRQARLAVEKRKSAMATAALARAPAPLIRPTGRPRGSLALIGIGPGRADWRTPEASRLIAGADLLVGYRLYLDLLGPVAAGKPRAEFALGEEEARCRHAL